MQSNHVIAYGMDEDGNYFPLPASSVPDFSAMQSLARQYSEIVEVSGLDGGASVIALEVPEGSDIYVHGFELLASQDSLGLLPLNDDGAKGLNQSGFFTGLTFTVSDAWSQSLTVGSIAELATATGTNPIVVNEAVPGSSPFRWVGGMLQVGQLVKGWTATDIAVDAIGAGSGYLQVRVVYSVVRLA